MESIDVATSDKVQDVASYGDMDRDLATPVDILQQDSSPSGKAMDRQREAREYIRSRRAQATVVDETDDEVIVDTVAPFAKAQNTNRDTEADEQKLLASLASKYKYNLYQVRLLKMQTIPIIPIRISSFNRIARSAFLRHRHVKRRRDMILGSVRIPKIVQFPLPTEIPNELPPLQETKPRVHRLPLLRRHPFRLHQLMIFTRVPFFRLLKCLIQPSIPAPPTPPTLGNTLTDQVDYHLRS
ncbi:hypothetical protein CJF30_00005057 [Rutstroemia sp. NJR-2017a BBW]|nr:hypothetical protein CJF30_00005057 [Rutstroemia sp. NJR-2017a BBW]